jgi:hypothetical protein
MKPNKINIKIGLWSALSTTLFALIYIVPQLIIGIDMPESKKDLFWILIPSMFLALSFLIMMISVHYYASEDKRIWSQIGMLLATAYFVFVNIVYFTVLTVTLPHFLNGDLASVEILRYVPKSFMTGIDALGYTSMSLATLFAAPVFFGTKLKNWIRYFFIANGIIAPIILSTQMFPLMAYVGGTWIITMPLSSFLFMLLCYNEMKNFK